jgi:hypothetical protein
MTTDTEEDVAIGAKLSTDPVLDPVLEASPPAPIYNRRE